MIPMGREGVSGQGHWVGGACCFPPALEESWDCLDAARVEERIDVPVRRALVTHFEAQVSTSRAAPAVHSRSAGNIPVDHMGRFGRS